MHGAGSLLGPAITAKMSVGTFAEPIVGVDAGITDTGSVDGEEVGSGVAGASEIG